MFGEITWKELSPELQSRINSGSGGTGIISVDSISTKKVTATVDNQTEFEIPFTYDPINSYLDIKINSVWIDPERYEVVGNKIILDVGVKNGTDVFFTLFSCAQLTPDGGYIEDVDVAETPQDVIVYDGSIIDEKVAEHNSSASAHEDIRDSITTVDNKVKWKQNDWKTESDAPSTYDGSSTTVFHNSSNAFNGRTQGIVTTKCFNSLLAYQEFICLSDRTTSKFYRLANRGADTWTEWKEIAVTSKTNDITLLNGWVTYGGHYQPPTASKIGNVVTLNGLVKGGTATKGTVVAILPEGYRPLKASLFTCINGGDDASQRPIVTRLNVTSNGEISLYYDSTNMYLTLDNISFSVT